MCTNKRIFDPDIFKEFQLSHDSGVKANKILELLFIRVR